MAAKVDKREYATTCAQSIVAISVTQLWSTAAKVDRGEYATTRTYTKYCSYVVHDCVTNVCIYCK